MTDRIHQVTTKDFSENLIGGIMICGINYGYSVEDEIREDAGIQPEPEPLSFFSDKGVNNTRFRNRILTWLSSWDFELATTAGDEGKFERAFFQTNWLDTQTRSITRNGAITHETLVAESDSFLYMLITRKPSVIIFTGGKLIEALNDERVRPKIVSIFGERSGNPNIYRGNLPNYTGTKFKLLAQEFGDTQIISVPHPQARGLSDEYVASLRPPNNILGKIMEKKRPHFTIRYPDPAPVNAANEPLHGLHDPLFQAAKAALADGEKFPISYLQRKFKLGHTRALKLVEALKSN